MVSLIHHPFFQYWFYTRTYLEWIYDGLHPIYEPLTYRLERHGFVFNEVIINVVEMLCIWLLTFSLILLFLMFRVICNPIHYFGEHAIDVEKSFRY